MGNLIATIEVPPVGELETSRNGTSPTDEQMAEEQAARDETIAQMRPYLESLPQRPFRRSGNVSQVELQGSDTWSTLNHYVVIAAVDIGDPGLEKGLLEVLPEGSKVSVRGGYDTLEVWSRPDPTE
jgi:hypothetical protein